VSIFRPCYNADMAGMVVLVPLLLLAIACGSRGDDYGINSYQSCSIWRAEVVGWIAEGNSFFDPRNPLKVSTGVPDHPRVSLSEAMKNCGTGFPVGAIAPDSLGYPIKYAVGKGASNVIYGRYQYRWSGGTKVEGRCKVILQNEQQGPGQHDIKGKVINMTVGEEFIVSLFLDDGPISFSTGSWGGVDPPEYHESFNTDLPPCSGLLVRVG